MLSNGTPMLDPITAVWNTVARFDDYESAQRAVFGFAAHAATRGKRDFSSVRGLPAAPAAG